jgi:hypothetical protein
LGEYCTDGSGDNLPDAIVHNDADKDGTVDLRAERSGKVTDAFTGSRFLSTIRSSPPVVASM